MSDTEPMLPEYTRVNDLESYSQTSHLKHASHNSLVKSETLLNFTDHDIQMQRRDGIIFTIPPQVKPQGYSRPGILVRVSYVMGKNVEIDGRSINAPTESQYHDIRAIADSVSHARVQRDQSVAFDIDYFIESLKVRKLGGSMYLEQLDMLISTLDGNKMPPHPHGRLSRHINVRDAFSGQDGNTEFYYRLRFVDNEGVYGTHYVNINGVAFAVEPIKDPEFQSGIHCYIPNKAMGEDNGDRLVHCEYEPIEEGIKKYGLYKTRQEALTHGNQKERFEADILTQKQTLKERELKVDEEKLDMARSMAELKSRQEKEMAFLKNKYSAENEHREERLAILKEERDLFKDRLEYDQLYRKDHYDNRSHARKDASEIIKFVPVALTAVAGVIGFFVGGQFK